MDVQRIEGGGENNLGQPLNRANDPPTPRLFLIPGFFIGCATSLAQEGTRYMDQRLLYTIGAIAIVGTYFFGTIIVDQIKDLMNFDQQSNAVKARCLAFLIAGFAAGYGANELTIHHST